MQTKLIILGNLTFNIEYNKIIENNISFIDIISINLITHSEISTETTVLNVTDLCEETYRYISGRFITLITYFKLMLKE